MLHRDLRLSPDGKYAAAEILDEATGTADIWIYDLNRRLRTRFTFDPTMDWFPVWTPDGKRIAFASDESGRFETYVTTFPEPTRRWQISTDGGGRARWGKNGRELFFRTPTGSMWAVDVDGSGDSFVVGEMEELFSWVRPPGFRPSFDVASDGQSFLINRAVDAGRAEPLTLVLNWDMELARDPR